jgi:hypothetical protein
MNPLQPTNHGGVDAFVVALDPTGTTLRYATYLGGSGEDGAWAISVDRAGVAYVTGGTASTDFPTVSPFQPTHHGGLRDAFVAALDPTGATLRYSTYLGGSGEETAYGIAVDDAGTAYVTGGTSSTDFPTARPLQPNNRGANAFVTVLNPDGATLRYSTYLGGSASEGGSSIAVDSAGAAYVTGGTSSTDFPTMNPLQPTLHGGVDAFVAVLDPSGATLRYATYLGGTANDTGYGIVVDSVGTAYVTGLTASTDFPTASPYQDTNFGQADAFIVKILQ